MVDVFAGNVMLTELCDSEDYYRILVNKSNPIAEDAAELTEFSETADVYGGTVRIEVRTLAAYEALRDCLAESGIGIGIDSCYRSVEEQIRIMEDFTLRYGEEYAKETVAEPGTSEHHTGLAVDIVIRKDDVWVTENADMMEETEIFAVIHEKLADFGFLLRYPKGKEAVTGYGYEPWHIRYVGTELAHAVEESGLTLDEFLQ